MIRMILSSLVAILVAAPAAAQWNGGPIGANNWKFGGTVTQPLPIIYLAQGTGGTCGVLGFDAIPLGGCLAVPPYTKPVRIPGGLVAYDSTSLGFTVVTNTFTKCTINYGLTESYGSSVTEGAFHTDDHSMVITGLTADTDYNYMFTCIDGFSNSASTGNFIVSTKSAQTLKQLATAKGMMVGNVMTDPNVSAAYRIGGSPAPVVENTEMHFAGLENDERWVFITNNTGNQYFFNNVAWNYSLYPNVLSYLHRITEAWGTNDKPSGMTVTPSTYVAQLQCQADNVSAWINHGSAPSVCATWGPTGDPPPSTPFINVTNEMFFSPPTTMKPSSFSTGSGNPYWWFPLFDRMGVDNDPSVLLFENDFSIGDSGTFNWGAASAAPGSAAQGNYLVSALWNIQQYFVQSHAGLNAQGFQMHTRAAFAQSDVDLQWVMWEIRRLGLEPIITEYNCEYGSMPKFWFAGGGSDARFFCGNVGAIEIANWMRTGGLKYIQAWTDGGLPGQLLSGFYGDRIAQNPKNGVDTVPSDGIKQNQNQKSAFYHVLAKMLTSGPAPASSGWPRAHRINFTNLIAPEVTTSQVPTGSCITSGCSNMIGTPGLITLLWANYQYRANATDTIHGFSQAAWTFDYQFYTQGSTGGNIFKVMDAGTNQLILVNWNAGTGVVNVTIGGSSPINVGTAAQNMFHGLVITKNGNNFSVVLDHGTVQTTTQTIAAIDQIQFLDNTSGGALNQRVNVTTFDVYENSSVVTGTTAMQDLSVFADNSPLYQSPDVTYWPVPNVSYTGPRDLHPSNLLFYVGLRCSSGDYAGNVADIWDAATGNTTETLLTCSAGGTINETINALATTCAVACRVKTLYDQSGRAICSNACDFSQSDNTKRPDLIVNCVGGKPCLACSSGRTLSTSIPPGIPSFSSPFTISYYAKRTGGFSSGSAVLGTGAGASQYFGFGASADTALYYFFGTATTAPATDGAWHSIDIVNNKVSTVNSDIFVDGVANHMAGTTATIPAGAATLCASGSAVPLTGNITEVFLAGSTWTYAQQKQLSANRAAYW